MTSNNKTPSDARQRHEGFDDSTLPHNYAYQPDAASITGCSAWAQAFLGLHGELAEKVPAFEEVGP